MARTTSAWVRSWSAINWRGPTATPSVLLPQAAVGTEANKQGSLTLHSGGAASRFGKIVNDFCFQWVSLCANLKTIPDLGGTQCRHRQCTRGLLSLRFPERHVAGSSAPTCFLHHQVESLESAASCCCVQLEVVVLPLGGLPIQGRGA